MITVVLVVHLMLAVALVGVVLLQKSEGGALGMGGGGMSGFMTGRSTANLLTRTTAVLAALLLRHQHSLGRARRAPARAALGRRPCRALRRRSRRRRCPARRCRPPHPGARPARRWRN